MEEIKQEHMTEEFSLWLVRELLNCIAKMATGTYLVATHTRTRQVKFFPSGYLYPHVG
jgi:hypothetical protein